VTLDPLAARRPDGGLFMWSEQWTGPQAVVSGHPSQPNSSAAALLSYDVPHKAPWDWRVSLYTWTKSLAAGAYLVPALLVLAGVLDAGSVLWQWIAPLLAGLCLAATGGLLIWDLEHPRRFYFLFTRSQRRSWLVRGGYVIAGYSAVLAAHVAAALAGAVGVTTALMIAGVPLAGATAVYTAYLLAQAKARDLWQSPMLAPHLLVQAVLAGAAALLPFVSPAAVAPAADLETAARAFGPGAGEALLWILGLGAAAHLLFVLAETTVVHATAHAKLAVWEMISGRYRLFFRTSVALMIPAMLAPWLGTPVAPLALAGLLAYEHAYVQAGQAVPLA
jgi:hypothetical protein